MTGDASLPTHTTARDDADDHTDGDHADDYGDAPATLDRRRFLHAFDWGAAAALGVGLVYGVLVYPVDLRWGLIAVGVMGGWAIGGAVKRGAWQGDQHMPSRRLRLLAALLGAVSWLGGMFVAYFLSQALFPDASTPLLERLSVAAFNEFISGTYELFHGLAIGALALFAWRSAS